MNLLLVPTYLIITVSLINVLELFMFENSSVTIILALNLYKQAGFSNSLFFNPAPAQPVTSCILPLSTLSLFPIGI